ncbi:phosphoadenosine phosphosulfate reductase family protein [Moraxella sp. ZJ142]|uniref:phosphoadenosine phosphosulfate reductase domain-containing protein n=1 Tax=Moraxella marmotae TaxID=3344520 RepID=UPI0035D525B0
MAKLFDPIKAQSRITDHVIVGFSGGKDSVVTLDLCCRYFPKVTAFFMYQVSDLSFQNAMIKWAERKYQIDIDVLPHFELSNFLAYGSFRHHDYTVPIIGMNDIYKFVRLTNNAWWIAAGERIADSIVRRAMMKKSGCIDEVRGRFYPIANFSKNDVMAYIKHHNLKYAPETSSMGHSFRSLAEKDMWLLKQHYPSDYQRVKSWFPFVEASVINYELTDGKK